ncbi:MAG TPA: hypothetical protein VH518_24785 [Tepidisphaeraceae bacterium]|jgi:hypothetical protein
MDDTNFPHLLADTEEGFADLSFRVIELARRPDGRLSVVASALFDGGRVGLRVILGDTWKPATLGDNIAVYWGAVTYESTGQESDRLVRALAAAYGLSPKAERMKDRITFTAVTLEGNPANCPPEPLRMKLFFESDAEEEYAEVYTNVDPEARSLGIREKDPDYRGPLLAAIAAPH